MCTGGKVITIHSKEEWDKQQAAASSNGSVVRDEDRHKELGLCCHKLALAI